MIHICYMCITYVVFICRTHMMFIYYVYRICRLYTCCIDHKYNLHISLLHRTYMVPAWYIYGMFIVYILYLHGTYIIYWYMHLTYICNQSYTHTCVYLFIYNCNIPVWHTPCNVYMNIYIQIYYTPCICLPSIFMCLAYTHPDTIISRPYVTAWYATARYYSLYVWTDNIDDTSNYVFTQTTT